MTEVSLVFQPAPPDATSRAFADALDNVVRPTAVVRVVSPYLSASVLSAVVKGRDVRLITDLEACLEGGAPPDLVSLLERHRPHVRTVPGVHAKVVLGDEAALLGSANLTVQAVRERFEMACLVRDPPLLDDLRAWFNALWEHASAVTQEQLRAAVERAGGAGRARAAGGRAPRPATGGLGWLASSGARRNRSVDVQLDELAGQIHGLTSTRAEARGVLDVFREALRLIDLPADDERLHLNFGRGRPVSVTLGQRCVVWLLRKHRIPVLGFLLDDRHVAEDAAERMEAASTSSFMKDGVEDAPALRWPVSALGDLPAAVRESWHRALRRQAAECNRSSYRAHKRRVLFELLMDERLWREALRQAHPLAWWFGVNNGRRGHMQLDDVLPLLDGEAERMDWPIGSSKPTPATAYAEMLPGDGVLLWTGHGHSASWGLLGTASVGSTTDDRVVLRAGRRFEPPITPYPKYPKERPVETETVRFLRDTLGPDFEPFGDVMRAVYKTRRRRPITVAQLPKGAFDAVVSHAEKRRAREPRDRPPVHVE